MESTQTIPDQTDLLLQTQGTIDSHNILGASKNEFGASRTSLLYPRDNSTKRMDRPGSPYMQKVVKGLDN